MRIFKPGDLVKHVKTGWVALVTDLPITTSQAGTLGVITSQGPGRWFMSSCKVINESR